MSQDSVLIEELLRQFRIGTLGTDSTRRVLGRLKDMSQRDRFTQFFAKHLSASRSFSERAAWVVFWVFASAGDSIAQSSHSTENEPELNGAFLKAIEFEARRLKPAMRSKSASDCIAVALLNLAKLGNEARTGADFGMVMEIEVEGRRNFLISHFQAKRANSPSISIDRKAGTSTQLDRLCEHGYGRYLFYNQLNHPTGLLPTTKSAELIKNELALRAELEGSKTVSSIWMADDLATSVANAVAIGAAALRQSPDGRQPWQFGYRYVAEMDSAIDLLFPLNKPDLAVSQLLVARVGERRYEPSDIASMRSEWEEALERRAATFAARGTDSSLHIHEDDDRLPPLKF